jgi:DNA-binding NarL/FixJ family response regulator
MPRVLIVDDAAGTRDAFSALLRLEGFETSTADSGAAALAYAAEHRFDVGLVDLNLPDVSGVDVIKELRARGTRTPLVVVTAFPALDSCFDAASVGADGYIDGPLLGDEICCVVRQALAGVHPVRHPARRPEARHESVARLADPACRPCDARILEVVRIIDAEVRMPWSIEALANRVGISASRLRHQFASVVGISLSRFILDRRLLTAARFFRSTRHDVHTVARHVGLDNDLRRFRRAFRERFGMSPSGYCAAFRADRDPDDR